MIIRKSIRIIWIELFSITLLGFSCWAAGTKPCVSVSPGKASPRDLMGKVICIDPGHQTPVDMSLEALAPGSTVKKVKNPGGAAGVHSRIPESKVNLAISLILRELLEKEGARVVMTRTTENVNLGNIDRANIANNAKADLFIRVHCDGDANSTVSGSSVLYPAKIASTAAIWEPSRRAARSVLEELVKSCHRKNRGAIARDDMAGFNWSKVPVILVEVAFLSNPEEDRFLNTPDFQAKAATGICQGVIGFFKTSGR